MKHLDLFSGIGGFALAADRVFGKVEHTFCDNDLFCQEVLKKHWPRAKIYGDIRTLTKDSKVPNVTANSEHGYVPSRGFSSSIDFTQSPERETTQHGRSDEADTRIDLLTGGFPCQPFSQAGRRQGTADDRYLWPEMLRVIREFHPRWIIGENVGGLVTWSEGLVLEQVHVDLESEGYEVQSFIIPAVAVNAPHRRDRVWIIAHSKSGKSWKQAEQEGRENISRGGGDVINTHHKGLEGQWDSYSTAQQTKSQRADSGSADWSEGWIEVATELCGMDDGLPVELDGFKLSKSKHREQRLKALGNAIVPQVAEEIMRAIKDYEPIR